MQEKILAQILPNGEIGRIVTTTDPAFLLDIDSIDITKHKDREKIKGENKYFKVKNGKIVEKSSIEKDAADEKLKQFQPKNPMVEILEDIQTRLTAVEKVLKDQSPKNSKA